jgi:TPR repeat protein
MHNLAVLYINAWGVEKDPRKAKEWLTKAAEHGNGQAGIQR